MSFQPYFPVVIIGLLVLAAVVLGVWSARRAPDARRWHVLLRLAALLLLGLILLNPVTRNEVEIPGLAKARLFVDTSASMSAFGRSARAEQALDAAKAACPANAQPDVVRFSDQIDGAIDGVRTHLSASLLTLLRETSRSETAAVTLISDACTDDDAALGDVIALARERRIPIHVLDPGPDAPANLALSRLRAPRTVRVRENVEVRARVSCSQADAVPAGAQVTVADSKGVIVGRASLAKAATQEVAINFPPRAGDQRYTMRIVGSPPGSLQEDDTLSFQIDGGGRPQRVLYLEGTPWTERLGADIVVKLLPIAWSKAGLQVDCWFMEDQLNSGGKLIHASSLGGKDYSGPITFDDQELSTERSWWDSFDLYVISDVNRELFTPEMIDWVRDAVIERGAGFVMIGGNTSFDTGGWQKTAWEKIIPAAILESGRGMIWSTIFGQVPPEVRSHPVWQIDPDAAINDMIIDAHPYFMGYHRILKAKPGATVLMQNQAADKQPLIMVQQYGRGRAMAFLSDAAGGWGVQYENWGPPTLNSNLAINQRMSATSNPQDLTSLIQAEQARHSAPSGVRHYYEKFWQNSAQWLAAGSLSTKDRTAELRANADGAAGVLRVTARTGLQATRGELNFSGRTGQLVRDANAGTWSGAMSLPNHLGNAAPLELGALLRAADGDREERIFIGSREVSAEFMATAPRRDLLEKLARETGGSVLKGPQAVGALASELALDGRTLSVRTDPAWATPWLWLVIFVLLGVEWGLRRLHGS